MTLSNETREFVRRRANDTCEYCGLPQHASVLPHQIGDIIGRHTVAQMISRISMTQEFVDR